MVAILRYFTYNRGKHRREEDMTIDFYAVLGMAEQRKRELRIDQSEHAVEAMRDKGAGRLDSKRAHLSAIDERAASASKTSQRSYY